LNEVIINLSDLTAIKQTETVPAVLYETVRNGPPGQNIVLLAILQ
jgi:hypothetical protein